MFKRIIAFFVALSVALPQVVLAAPFVARHPLLQKYVTYNPERHIYIDVSHQIDSWRYRLCHTLGTPDAAWNCWKPKEILPDRLVLVRIDLFSQASRIISNAPMRRVTGGSTPCVRQAKLAMVGSFTDMPPPKEFFSRWVLPLEKNPYGVRVWTSFLDRVVSEARLVDWRKSRMIRAYDLVRHAYDDEIQDEIERYTWDPSEACFVIARLICIQRDGQPGILLTDGHANVFFVGPYAVPLMWCGIEQGWAIGAWKQFGGHFWVTGDRVFVPEV
jgi:hypothetical protein